MVGEANHEMVGESGRRVIGKCNMEIGGPFLGCRVWCYVGRKTVIAINFSNIDFPLCVDVWRYTFEQRKSKF